MNSVEPLDHRSESDVTRELLADARIGLTDSPKWLPPKWFYDARGSELFERITELPEYYQTRAEYEILERYALDIVERTGVDTLVELGSGSSYKTRLLLDAMRKHGAPKRFVPSDVSRSALRGALSALSADYPELELHGIVGDFATTLAVLPTGGERMIALLGGTIGNMPVEQRGGFLGEVRSSLVRGEWFLLGTDLVKDPSRLCRAYDDSAGVTAEFNRNVLHVLNRELGADFPVEEFEHRARYEQGRERIVLALRARRAMRVWLRVPELAVELARGEEIETEMSAKFRRGGVEAELEAAGFELAGWYTDEAGDFAVSLARAR
ncbi:L-histidine N-alpha-methyltransferase [Actinopolyspora biskrensis]|uniref:L-histidine N-alpha-methyltransferase n=1 Tax=Actinopolyspora biskrensis TaxID=1470178 RepID=A0A852YUH2_9ACTN|nr:L-histidine N(alpha)-methyltransferase [Actinopolyspora biskrensis]NYH78331.1 L-histidine N-alpha-methyltransferase [Actinopolyspora biskrensis]